MKQQIKGFLAVLLLGSILSTGCTGPEDVPSSGGLPPDSMDGHAILRVVSPPAEPAGGTGEIRRSRSIPAASLCERADSRYRSGAFHSGNG